MRNYPQRRYKYRDTDEHDVYVPHDYESDDSYEGRERGRYSRHKTRECNDHYSSPKNHFYEHRFDTYRECNYFRKKHLESHPPKDYNKDSCYDSRGNLSRYGVFNFFFSKD